MAIISIRDLIYYHPDKELLFNRISIYVEAEAKMSLIGNNGSGKSTLLKIISGDLTAGSGTVETASAPYLVPQILGQYNDLSVAQALRIEKKLEALKAIENGEVTEYWLDALNDDWSIEARCDDALRKWQLEGIGLDRKLSSLSGGQKTKLFLSGIDIHQPKLILLDEPGNHLDRDAYDLLCNLIRGWPHSLLLVSHDRRLLNLVDTTLELSSEGIKMYGGNYQFYADQKKIERLAFQDELKEKEKALRKAKMVEREATERQQKLNARGKNKQIKSGLPTISMNTLRNNAEKTSARTKTVHEGKRGTLQTELNQLRKNIPAIDHMKFELDDSSLHKNKLLVKAENLNHHFNDRWLWNQPLNFLITGGERLAINGENGSGKTTLIRMIKGELEPAAGKVVCAAADIVYIDQEYSLINDRLSVFQQAEQFNICGLQEHEINIRLNRFLLGKEFWNQSCSSLSGGERMRLMLCCLTMKHQSPDILILDEPTNNLDLQNLEILAQAINGYHGALIVVSHDRSFLEGLGIKTELNL